MITIGFWIFYNHLPDSLITMSMKSLGDFSLPEELTLIQRLLGLLISLVPLAIQMVALVTLLRLLRLYRDGSVFSGAHVACFKRLGQSLVAYACVGIVQKTAIVLVMTMNNPPGKRMLTLGISSDDITLFVVGAIVLMISWVMDEGRKLTEEQTLTV